MAGFADTFFAVAAHPAVGALGRDGRAAIVFDRSGTRVLFANPAGLAALGLRRAADLRPLSPTSPTARRIALLSGRLGETPRVDRVPLPAGFVPVQATSALRRIQIGVERYVLLVVLDGLGELPAADAPARWEALVAEVSGAVPRQQGVAGPITPARAALDAAMEGVPRAAIRPGAAAAPGPAQAAASEDRLAEAEDAIGAEAPLAAAPQVEPAAEAEGAPATEETTAAPAPGELASASGALAAEDLVPPDHADELPAAETPAAPEPAMAEAVETEAQAPPEEVVQDLSQAGSSEPEHAVAEMTAEDAAVPSDEAAAAEPTAVAEAPQAPEEPAPEPAPAAGFAFVPGRTVRFVFELDPSLAFVFVSPELAEAVGPHAAALAGRTWAEVAAAFALDPSGRVGTALRRHDTFTGLTVEWPVENAALAVPVDLAGMPVFGRDRAFRGYRGFGLARCGAAHDAPVRVGPAATPPAEPAEAAPLTDAEIAHGLVVVEAEVDDALPPAEADRAEGLERSEAADPAVAETDGEPGTVAPGALEAEADDLGAAWAPSNLGEVITPPAVEAPPPLAAPPEPGPSAQERAEEELATPPPDEDPAAPDAAPEIMTPPPPRGGGPTDAAAADAPDLGWRDQTRGEVIPSPIVPRAIPRQVISEEEASRRQLSRPEREAFQKIAEALGARFEDGMGAGPPVDDADETEIALPVPARAPEPVPPEMIVLDRLPVAVAILKDGEAVNVNRAFLELAGYPDRESLETAGGFAQAFAGSTLPRDASLPAIRRRDGVEVPVSAKLHSIPWGGSIASLLVVQAVSAATARERAEAAEARVDELEAILDTATDGVLVLDGRGTVLGANRSAEALFGRDRSAMVGEPLLDLLAPESHRAALDYLDGLGRNGVASVLNDGREVIGRERQGGLVPLFMTIGRVSAGKFCAVLRDITQWKRAEEELVNARRSAETASSQKSDFLAKISHEIRTPLNAIIGFSEVMMEERFGPVGSERYKEYLRDIHLSGAHIMSLVNDLLDLSKIEAGKLDLAFEAVPVNEVIRECVALMQPQANRERVIIRTSLSSSLPNVVADSRSLRQIVLNLVSNAIKFNTPGGQVIVSTLYEESGEVAIRVRDTGTGMSEEDVAKALEPFRQLHTARPGRGTGLGLPLTKALVEANRAAFRIESSVGVGTLVQVIFPSTRVLAE